MLTALTFERAFDMAKHANSSSIAAPALLYLDDEAARSIMFGGLAHGGGHHAPAGEQWPTDRGRHCGGRGRVDLAPSHARHGRAACRERGAAG